MIKNSVRRKEKRAAAKWLQSLIGDGLGHPRPPARCRQAPSRPRQHQQAIRGGRSPEARGRKAEDPQRTGGDGRFAVGIADTESATIPRASGCNRLSQQLIIRHFEGVPRQFRIDGEIITKPETVYFTGRQDQEGRNSA